MNLYHVTKFSPYFSFTLHCFYTKISSFMPVLTIGIVPDCFYLLIFYSEKFWRLPFAVNVNLSVTASPRRSVNWKVTSDTRRCFFHSGSLFVSTRKAIRYIALLLHLQIQWWCTENIRGTKHQRVPGVVVSSQNSLLIYRTSLEDVQLAKPPQLLPSIPSSFLRSVITRRTSV